MYIINNIDYFLKVYTQTDIKSTNSNKYRTGSIQWPVLNGKDVTVRVSLGRNTLEDPKKKNSETIKKDFETVKSFLISNRLLKK